MEERLQKILARVGFGSRRTCETIISAGRVRINGHVAQLGGKADPAVDHITVDGSPLPKAEPLVYVALNKPRGIVSTVDDPLRRTTVRDLIPLNGTLYPVGRLDEDSEGLILLTNDGDLANRLTHPKYGHEKEYRVLVARHPDAQQLDAWRRGIVLEDGYKTAPAQVFVDEAAGQGAWLNVVLREGRKRQIREVGERIGLPVVRIVRVRIGSLRLGRLKPSEWRTLTSSEVAALRKPPTSAPRQPRSSASRPGADEFNKRPPRQSGTTRSEHSERRPTRGSSTNTRTGPPRNSGDSTGSSRLRRPPSGRTPQGGRRSGPKAK